MVKWKGFTSEWDTWEPARNLESCTKKIAQFEKQNKQKPSATQKYAQKLVNRSKMTQQNSEKKAAVKLKEKQVKKTKATVKAKDSSIISLDDVFKSVLEETTAEDIHVLPLKKQKGQVLPRKRSLKAAPGSSQAKKSKTNGEKLKKNAALEKKNKNSKSLKLPVPKTKAVMKAKVAKGIVKKSQNMLNKKDTKTKVNKETSSKKKSSHEKNVQSLLKNKESLKGKQKMELADEKATNTTPKEKGKGCKIPPKGQSPKQSSPGKSGGKKKNMLKLSVSNLIGQKSPKTGEVKQKLTKSLHGSFTQKPVSGIKTSKPVKVDAKEKVHKEKEVTGRKKRKHIESVISIETDSDSDSDILYSLADTSISEVSESPRSVTTASKIKESSRTKSESSISKNKKEKQSEKIKKSKSTSSAMEKTEKGPSSQKKMRLLDSLKSPTSVIPGEFLKAVL